VDDVTRTHQAEVYEIQTVESPEKIIIMMRRLRYSTGKFLAMFTDDQSSRNREETSRIGIVRRLL
jgi:hypothetical protein